MRRREKLEIIHDILNAIRKHETHTSNATLKIFKPVYSKFQQIHGRLLKKGLVRKYTTRVAENTIH
jgi:predicted transcriptional regulator